MADEPELPPWPGPGVYAMTRRRDIGWKATWLVGVLLVALSGACEPAWDGPALEAERPPQVVPGADEPPSIPGPEPSVPVAPGSVSPHVQVLDSLAVSHAVSRAAREGGAARMNLKPDSAVWRIVKPDRRLRRRFASLSFGTSGWAEPYPLAASRSDATPRRCVSCKRCLRARRCQCTRNRAWETSRCARRPSVRPK